MRIAPEQIEIPLEKITGYLLIAKEKNDKSAFLANLGYTIITWTDLINDIRQLAQSNDAYLQQKTPFGDIYEIRGRLRGLGVVTIWLLTVDSGKFRFITLFPHK